MQKEYAAGCVVFFGDMVLLIHHERDEWRLPKGRMEPGEKPAETACREVEEETGIPVRVEEYVAASKYTFTRPGVPERFDKTVYWFLATPVGADATLAAPRPVPQVEEGIDKAVWLGVDEASALLTFAEEKEVLARARARAEAKSPR